MSVISMNSLLQLMRAPDVRTADSEAHEWLGKIYGSLAASSSKLVCEKEWLDEAAEILGEDARKYIDVAEAELKAEAEASRADVQRATLESEAPETTDEQETEAAPKGRCRARGRARAPARGRARGRGR
jgi:hypothetical protein